jgi:RhtB (resistance to homoserine/threonine) family protein
MTEFIMVTLIASLMIISPGPDFAIVVKNSLVNGRACGLFASVGIGLANLCHVTINLLGIGVIISNSLFTFTILKVLGAIYLLYLGYKGLRAKAVVKINSASDKAVIDRSLEIATKAKRQGFYSGLLTSLLNPKACLFYLSFFSVILSPEIGLITQIFYGVWISTIALLWFMLVAFFFTSEAMGRKLEASKHWLERVVGGILLLLGLRLLKNEVI